MGKGEKETNMKKQSAEAVQAQAKERATIPMNAEITQVDVNDNCTRYIIGEGLSLDIVETDSDTDYGSLNVYGVVVKVTYRTIKNGDRAGRVFASMPSVKTKDGSYNNLVTVYNKDIVMAINRVLGHHYNGDVL